MGEQLLGVALKQVALFLEDPAKMGGSEETSLIHVSIPVKKQRISKASQKKSKPKRNSEVEDSEKASELSLSLDQSIDILEAILNDRDILARERAIDSLYWEKLDAMTVQHYFDMDVILAFILKLHIIDRWHQLDEKTGREMFRKLVNEVKATFKGVEYNPERSDRTDNNIKQQ